MKKFIHEWSWVILITFCIVGLFVPVIGIIALVCMIAPSIFAFFKGRIWCGNFCPRGSFNDMVLSKISKNIKVPKAFRTKTVRLGFLAALMTAFGIQLFFAWGDINQIGTVFVRMIIVTTIITIIIGIMYKPRAWCIICPMGTMAHYAYKIGFKGSNISYEKSSCVSCKLCNKNCPMELDVLSYKESGEINSPDCIKCGVCTLKCPKKSLSL